ncbi:uncharacterized protein LDX57_004770 [Aspergillus melleus]|uniref:uncharacterized protein n=1 Tax=Aspergillus melleus TaxID=138277 RepID=UPI001E8E64BD|nr:uncharacterized protein LDX57_004770 [Aspergillus melleus]KAH8427052.1 hypothetical protein LDX57_004770 [Aspergillus melleus]
MLKNTVFLAVLLAQNLSFTVALPSPNEEEARVAAAENGHGGGDNIIDCDITVATVTDYIPGPTATITVITTDIIEPTADCPTDVPVPTQTITAPGPTETITEPGPTETITEPGPTETVTEPPVTETDTITITIDPGTVTGTETVTETDTITESVTVTQTTTEVTTTTSCPTDTPTGGPDTGDCTPPTISYYPDRDPNQAFQIDDTDIYGHGTSALISTLTSHTCNQLRSPCNAAATTVQYCWSAAAMVDASGLQGEAQAEYWNSFWT